MCAKTLRRTMCETPLTPLTHFGHPKPAQIFREKSKPYVSLGPLSIMGTTIVFPCRLLLALVCVVLSPEDAAHSPFVHDTVCCPLAWRTVYVPQ